MIVIACGANTVGGGKKLLKHESGGANTLSLN